MENWTFNILKRTKTDENTLEIVVEFNNGASSFKRIFYATRENLSRTWLENQIKREVKIFENAKSFIAGINPGIFRLTPEAEKNQDEIKRQNFYGKLSELRTKTEYVSLGLLQEADIVALRSEALALGKSIGEI